MRGFRRLFQHHFMVAIVAVATATFSAQSQDMPAPPPDQQPAYPADQAPPPPGDGCGSELDWWFTDEALHPAPSKPPRPLRLADLPRACAALVAASIGQALHVPAGAR